ncbi:hypothetical protein PG994_012246 [Apiospora phragmitis]|uniref:U1 small nuclear ribonucleoprotein C n=1 Tax=Apiospora phragmitis TaxID=2905665 RepID=A0ABR1TV26_9PEZI
MPKFFCDYCDVYLTHDSMSVRKAHNSGRNHLRNVVDYYQQIGHEKAQSVIDSITSSYAAEGQAHANPMLPQNQPHATHHHLSHHGAPGSGPRRRPRESARPASRPCRPRAPVACPSRCPPACRLCPVCLAARRRRWAPSVAQECLVVHHLSSLKASPPSSFRSLPGDGDDYVKTAF